MLDHLLYYICFGVSSVQMNMMQSILFPYTSSVCSVPDFPFSGFLCTRL